MNNNIILNPDKNQLPLTRAAMLEYEKSAESRSLLWASAETVESINAAEAADEEALNVVRRAYYQDTKEYNTEEDCMKAKTNFLFKYGTNGVLPTADVNEQDFPLTRAAMIVFEQGKEARNLLWKSSQTNSDVLGADAAEKAALDIVRQAYFQDTKDFNREVDCMKIGMDVLSQYGSEKSVSVQNRPKF